MRARLCHVNPHLHRLCIIVVCLLYEFGQIWQAFFWPKDSKLFENHKDGEAFGYWFHATAGEEAANIAYTMRQR